jgi:DNA-3-methyladenine glycosylase
MIVKNRFFHQQPQVLARSLLGKVLRHLYHDPDTEAAIWLSARIIETEAYYLQEKGSHSSLGFTEKRKAMFMPPGTIYMYYDPPAQGKHNKGGKHVHHNGSKQPTTRPISKLCSGQTLLCRALGLKVADWNQQQLTRESLYLEDDGYSPHQVIQCRRLGIPAHRDPHLLYRFVDEKYCKFCTSNPLTRRNWQAGKDYNLL